MAVNKVDINGETVLDLTGDSVTPETLLQGATAHNAAGEKIEGSVAIAPASDVVPLEDGDASPGTEESWARGDHVHPSKVLICTITGSGTTASPYVCSKTTTEIWAAIQAGKQVVMKYATIMHNLVGAQGPQVAFFTGLTSNKSISQFTVMYGGNVSRVLQKIPTPDSKTDSMTQAVGMDSDGKLYTAPPDTSALEKTIAGKLDAAMPDNPNKFLATDANGDIHPVLDATVHPDGGIAFGKEADTAGFLDSAYPIHTGSNFTAAGNIGTDAACRVGYGIELGLKSTGHGGYLDFHYEGDESDYTTRLIEQAKGVLTLTGEWANPTKRKNFDQTGVSVTTYPTSAGIYHLIGTNIFSNLTPGSNYGTLVIFRSTYGMHLYLDSYNNLYYGRGGNDSGLAEPTTWQLVDGIVEEGKSGMWTYRKYASGRLECFGTKTYTGNASSQWGSMYVLSCTAENYPVAFVDYPNIQREAVLNNAAGCWIASYGAGSKTNCGTFALVRPTSMAVNVSVKFFATGHWK